MTDDHTHRGDDVHPVEAVEREDNGGWQPIETAPKDGTKFVFLRIRKGVADDFMYFTDIGWFDDSELCVPFDGYGSEPDEMWPTHWMPLPAAPTEGKHLTPPEE
jgi:hypothetical protein